MPVTNNTRGIPEGYREIKPVGVYISKTHLIITGIPEDDEGRPEEEQHNCDQMGCRCEHVLAWLPLSAGVHDFNKEETAVTIPLVLE